MSINVGQRQAVSSVSSQSRAWSKVWVQPLESRHNELLLQSYFQFRFGGRHLESAIQDVGRCRQLHNQVGRGRKCGGSRWNYVCMLLQTQVTSTSRKSSIFPGRVPLVFQLAPGTGKSYVHGRNVKTSGIGPSWNRFSSHFKIRTGRKNIREKRLRACLSYKRQKLSVVY